MNAERLGGEPPIAIVGMSCLFPGAATLEALWQNLLDGRDAFREVPPERWPWPDYYSADRQASDKTYCKVGAFLEGFAFSWRKYRIPPKVAEQLNPMHLVLIEATGQALEDAGFPRRPGEAERTGYVLGSLGLGIKPDYGLRVRMQDYLDGLAAQPRFQALRPEQRQAVLAEGRNAVGERLAPIFEDGMLGAIASIPVGRALSIFGLRGPHFVVDAGYGSSAAAVDAGIQSLREGSCDTMLVAGASPYLYPLEFIAFSRLGALSEQHLLPFDERADGTLFGEGAGVLVLVRLEDAVRDGHRVYATISGVGCASNGAGPALFAPSASAQVLAQRRCLQEARITPDDVQFVECHATGTPLGDTVEVDGLAETLGGRSRRLPRVALGAVKELVGHLQAGAGMAGLIKTALALHRGVLPPQHRFHRAPAQMQLEERPLEVLIRAQPWRERAGTAPLRALVNSIGFGGVNYTVCLEGGGTDGRPPARAMVRARREPEPVAIIGMGGVFPKAGDVPSFWRNNVEGVDAIREVPRERFELDRYYDESGQTREKSYSRLGAFLDDLRISPALLKLPPRAVGQIDPTQLLVLKAAAEAMAGAGFPERAWDRDSTAVFIADMPQRQREMEACLRVSAVEYRKAMSGVFDQLGVDGALRDELLAGAEQRFQSAFPPLTEDTLIGYLGGIISGRLARNHGLRGPNVAVEAACASSLQAIALAVRGLRQERFSVALAGGVCTNISPEIFAMVCAFNGMSRRGIWPFDAKADGFLVGEGAGVLALKRLRDARRDGDRVLAVIRGVGESSDGEGRNLFAPNAAAQALALRRALEDARLAPSDIDYIECHGTGTAVGDVSEVEAYIQVYGEHGRSAPIALSSVKSMIGHLNAAAGVAGVIRATCAIGAEVIPPTLHFTTPNPALRFEAGPFQVISRATPWPRRSGPRRAAVSAFGLGGANIHILLEQEFFGHE